MPVQTIKTQGKSPPASCNRDPDLPRIRLLDSAHPQRMKAENWVRRIYLRAYQARIENFYPWLLSLGNRHGGLSIVAGFRPACNTSLFCEHYLDQPIEELLGGSRKEIVEVGNLAPAIPGQARLMITMVTAFLHGAGFRQVVFTAVPKLYNAFHRLGLEPSELAVADPSRLPGGAEGWGTYYASGPRVYSGNIAWGHSVLAGQTGELENFRQCALKLGQRHGGHLWGKRK